MTVRLLPYSRTSRGARLLSKGIGALKITNVRQHPRKGDVLVNWGNSQAFVFPLVEKVFNLPARVALAVNKIAFYQVCRDRNLPGPTWTTDKQEAIKWGKTGIVLARTKIASSQGRGIIVVEKGTEMPEARLYVKYHPKKTEYRIHVINGEIVDVQQKKMKNGYPNPNYRIRNHGDGWIFSRIGVVAPKEVTDAASQVVTALGLDFGAVDIGWNESKKKVVVYEVNTAPGLVGTTLKIYTTKITRMIENYAQAKNGGAQA